MSRIAAAFEGKKPLIALITGGDPDIRTTRKLIFALEEAGADMIIVGVPFSDPVAESTLLQQAEARSLANGCTTLKLFEMMKAIHKRLVVPILFMTYMNPVFRYGKELFIECCKEYGIEGLIIPDLPFEERDEIKDECIKYDITLISMIAPSKDERIEKIAAGAEGFLYCISSMGAVGMHNEMSTNVANMIQTVRRVSKIPCVVGFGISTAEHVRRAMEISDGVVVGSAIVRIVAEHGEDSPDRVKEFVAQLKGKTPGG